MDKETRKEVFKEIENLFENGCRVCPHEYSEHNDNPNCQVCPILVKIQEQGAKIGGYDKSGFMITQEDYAIAEKNGLKRATVQSRVWHRDWKVEDAITRPAMIKKK